MPDIDTREELVNALSDAAELEHNLLCLYLFASFSLKDGSDEIPDPLLRATVDGWRDAVMGVARQEMGHLGTVCNLLIAVGGAPHFARPNFPAPPGYYPPSTPFTLERFTPAQLARFVEFERRQDEPGASLEAIAPDAVPFEHVGELYQAIRRAFETMDEATLFIGQDPDDSWGGVDVSPARNRREALAAIDVVVAEGEGTPAAGPSSHYQTFLGISRELRQLRHDHPQFDPARAVVPNPMTRRHRDNQGMGTLLGEPFTREVSELFNALYGSLLRVLAQYYSYAGESASQRATLQDVAVDLMYGVIRPLGVALTRLPADPATPGLTAGPSFEIYGPLGLPRDLHLAARIVLERLIEEAQEARRLEQLPGIAAPAAAALKRSAATVDAAVVSLRQEFQL